MVEDKKIVVGSLVDYTSTSNCKKCSRCGVDVYFYDEWDWKNCLPICQDCFLLKHRDVDVDVTKETRQNVKELLGISDGDIDDIIREIRC